MHDLVCPVCRADIEVENAVAMPEVDCPCGAKLRVNYDYHPGEYYDGWWFLEEVNRD